MAHGADALGLVGAMPSGPGPIDDALIASIAALTPPPVATFLLSSRVTAHELVGHARSCGTSCIQIVRHVDPAVHEALAASAPSVRRVQVIHVEDADCLKLLPAYAPRVHAFLLDSGRPNAAIAELGGTARTHDWRISAQFVRRSPVPVFLAGGINPENVAEAIARVRPWGIDVCSGLRSSGQLDAQKLAAIVAAMRRADAGLA